MALETATYIDSLVTTWPDAATDTVSQGDDHIRLLKAAIKRTFPEIAAEVSASAGELNALVGVSSAIQTQLDGKAGLASQNTFTDTQIISNTQPVLRFNETDAASDEKLWSVYVSSNNFVISTREDDNDPGIQAFTVVRGSGTAITSVSLRASVADQLKLTSGGNLTFTNGTVSGQLSYSVTPTLQFGSSSSHNLDLVAGGTTRLTVRTDGAFTQQNLTVATLPSAAAGLTGARAFVTDANATTFASVVAGGGSNKVPVYCDGSNWRIG